MALLHQHLLNALHFTHHFLIGDGLGIDHRHNKVGLAGFQLLKGWWQGANGRAPLAQAQTLRLQSRHQTQGQGKHPNGLSSYKIEGHEGQLAKVLIVTAVTAGRIQLVIQHLVARNGLLQPRQGVNTHP